METVLERDYAPGLRKTVLLLVLVIATAYRFYGVDHSGLWASELWNAASVTHRGFLDVLSGSIQSGVDLPGYPVLLYVTSQLFGHSELGMRLLSVLSGIGSVYLLLLLGRACGSLTGGFLAALLLAGSGLAVRYSQEAQSHTLFVFLALLQCFIFLGHFRAAAFHESLPRPVSLLPVVWRLGGVTVSFESGRYASSKRFSGFWLASILLLFVHYAGFFVVVTEYLLCVCFSRGFDRSGLNDSGREQVAALARSIFPPLLGFGLLFFPVVFVHIEKIMTMPDVSQSPNLTVKSLILTFSGTSRWLQGLELVGCLMVIFHLMRRFMSRTLDADDFSVLVLFCIVFVTLLSLLANIQAQVPVRISLLLLFSQPFIFLFVGLGVCGFVRRFLLAIGYQSFIVGIVVAVIAVSVFWLQILQNRDADLFSRSRKPDLRQPIQIIAADQDFMRGFRTVFTTNSQAEYYLDYYGIRQYNPFSLEKTQAGNARIVRNFFSDDVFYFLDVAELKGPEKNTALFDALSTQYGMLCMTRFSAATLVKFKGKPSRLRPAAIPTCEEFLRIPTVISPL